MNLRSQRVPVMQRLTSPQSKKRPTVSKVMLLTEVLKKPQIAANLGTFFY